MNNGIWLKTLRSFKKLNKDFKVWLEEMHPKTEERREFMRKHYIPQDVDLSFENFEEFFYKRNGLLLEELRKVLYA